MAQEEILSKRELNKRNLILNGDILKAIMIIGLPILFYNLCNYLYGIYDMMVVQKANIGEAADIVVLNQIKEMISTIGASIATGGGILIARYFGAKDTAKARRCANTLVTMALIVILVTFVFIPTGVPFLKLLKTDQTTIDNAMGYYNVQIIILMVVTINNCIIAIEKSKGNTTKLLFLNLGVIVIKISLTTLFAFGPFENVTITWLAVATLIAQSFMLIVGGFMLLRKSNSLRIWFNTLNLDKNYVKPILVLSLPIFIGRFLFTFGKVYVNSVATDYYGKACVGALGISNTIAGFVTNIVNSFEDAGATIVSQNYGNKNGKRIRKFFFYNFVVIETLAIIGMLVCFVLRAPIAAFFAPGDQEYQKMIITIFRWECFDLIFTGLSGIAGAIFYGFGKTRITMVLSVSILFVFRIPTLLILMYVANMNYEACGVAMFVSNTASGTIYILIASTFLFTMHKKEKYKDLFTEVKPKNILEELDY